MKRSALKASADSTSWEVICEGGPSLIKIVCHEQLLMRLYQDTHKRMSTDDASGLKADQSSADDILLASC